MQRLTFGALLVLVAFVAGCDSGNTIVLPTDKLTPEQEAKIKIEDQKVDDEESQGKKGAKKK